MNKPPLFLFVIVIIIIIAAFFRYTHLRRQQAENETMPLSIKKVAIANKREKPSNDRRSRQREVIPAGETMRYEVGFMPQKVAVWK